MNLETYETNEKLNYAPEIFYSGSKFTTRPTLINGHSDFNDSKGYYFIHIHDHIAYRYQIIKILGKGAFGNVVLAFDHKLIELKAIKIIRDEARFNRQVVKEIEILNLMTNENGNTSNIIDLLSTFIFRGHTCLVFPYLGSDIYSKYMRDKRFKFFEDETKYIIREVLISLDFLKKHNIIHCDLKPENILIYKGKDISKTKDQCIITNKTKITLIDFGSSILGNPKKMLTYIQSRWYRGPEVILGGIEDHNVSTSIDMWSLGCIVYEFLIGKALFNGKTEADQIYLYNKLLGYPEKTETLSRLKYFFYNSRFDSNLLSSQKILHTKLCEDFDNNMKPYPLAKKFIMDCLTWGPNDRLTPEEGLKHQWLKS